MPNEIRFSLPANRYLNRHQRPPEGAISRYKPRPSKSFAGLLRGLAFTISRRVRGIGGKWRFRDHFDPELPPMLPPPQEPCQRAGYPTVTRLFYQSLGNSWPFGNIGRNGALSGNAERRGCGGTGGDRTHDQSLKRALLYQL